MHQFLTANRSELIARCRAKVAQRSPPGVPSEELANGVSIFLDQLIKTLIVERTETPMLSRRVSDASGGGKPALSEMSDSATRHGKELQEHEFTVEEVVHDYGDLCQSIFASRSLTWRSRLAFISRLTSSARSTDVSTMPSPAQ
ncbi:hypothetical protein ACYX7E_14845 [Luteimonas sp. RIT-PG2_3]